MEKKIINLKKVAILDELLCLTSIDDAVIVDEEQDYKDSVKKCVENEVEDESSN